MESVLSYGSSSVPIATGDGTNPLCPVCGGPVAHHQSVGDCEEGGMAILCGDTVVDVTDTQVVS